ncbi:hypothetical protein SAMN04488128_105330 [Chitinophaga eiseniae]|uniref:Membrane bound FAD containing D-sorbitol dehydrogenase n=1 Tax=Chitinophaga eiseniae TaxID=634771 RepID=A0A1T4TL30_9BACT|nr:hypothetical protein [Chitinophaga eiseniae]SKA41077.1 hypothetical protein SAMN04488128_105330 [Chitinophaga eiseniae]
MEKTTAGLDAFLAISVPLTGYNRVALLATGMAQLYLDAVQRVIGAAMTEEYLALTASILKDSGGKEPALDRAIRQQLLASLQYGPITRNIIQLWYWGSWLQLPSAWVAKYGKGIKGNENHFVTPEAYQQGLIWNAMGSHPQGAEQPGFGSWSVASKVS